MRPVPIMMSDIGSGVGATVGLMLPTAPPATPATAMPRAPPATAATTGAAGVPSVLVTAGVVLDADTTSEPDDPELESDDPPLPPPEARGAGVLRAGLGSRGAAAGFGVRSGRGGRTAAGA